MTRKCYDLNGKSNLGYVENECVDATYKNRDGPVATGSKGKMWTIST